MTLHVAAEPFATVEDVHDAECACITRGDPDDDVLEELIDVASDVITIATGGYVFGRATATVLPCADMGCFARCACGCGLDGIPLPDMDPKVSGVYVDDVLIPSTEYRIHRTTPPMLVKISTDGRPPQPWPRHQHLWKNGTGDDTFRFTLTWGIHNNAVIRDAAVEIVCYLAADPKVRRLNALPKGTASASAGNVAISTFTRQRDTAVERVAAGAVGPATAMLMEIYAPYGPARPSAYAPELESGWTLHMLEQAS
jgi:hypothetical protein